MADHISRKSKRLQEQIGTGRKKVIESPQKAPESPVIVPTLDTLMNDALAIIGSELAHYRSKTKRGLNLGLKEARIVQYYMDSLVKMSRDSREQARAEDLADLSNEELLQLATSLAENNAKITVSGETKQIDEEIGEPE
jgi:hypothetical protein